MGLNKHLDALPRARVRLGKTVLPVYLTTGLAGVGLGGLANMTLAIGTGRSLVIAAAVSVLSCVVFVLLLLVRSFVFHSPKIILLEQLLAVEAAGALALTALGLPVLEYLDMLSVGLAVFLTCGRIGCFLCGCCYGIESTWGVRYPAECGHGARVRRLPTQLVEAAAWAFFAVASALMVLLARSGSALVLVLAGYGALRLMLEPLRGDTRPRFLGLTEAAWLSLVALAAAAYVQDGSLRVSIFVLSGCALFSLIAVAALALTRKYWLKIDFQSDTQERVVTLAREIRTLELTRTPIVRKVDDLVFAASLEQDALSVSVSSPTRLLDGAEATLLLEWLSHGLGVHALDLAPIEVRAGVYLSTLSSPSPSSDRVEAAAAQ